MRKEVIKSPVGDYRDAAVATVVVGGVHYDPAGAPGRIAVTKTNVMQVIFRHGSKGLVTVVIEHT